MLFATLALPAIASEAGKISGYVKDSGGVPQMGAMVEVYGPGARTKTIFTDAHGFYSVAGLASGIYQLKVTAPSFLPSLKERVSIRSGASLFVNVTLNTLFEALQMMPSNKSSSDQEDDWKWTLRSNTNRPALRVVDDVPFIVSSAEGEGDKVLRAHVAFMAGAESEGLGSSAGMSTAFNVERSMFGAGTVSFDGNLAHGADGIVPAAVVRAAYSHRMADGSEPKIAFMMRRFSTPIMSSHDVSLQALALTLSNSFTLGNALELNVGTELQDIQLGSHAAAVYPFGTATFHLTPNTLIEYGYATFEPTLRQAKGYSSAPADLSESGPRVSMANWKPVIERARHHELSVSRRAGKNSVQLAVYSDRLRDPALTGTGDATQDSGFYLPDMMSGTFAYTGRSYSTQGVRAVYERKLGSNVAATLDYAFGGVLDADSWTFLEDVKDSMSVRKRHAIAYKMSGTVPGCKGKWIASYRWTSGSALTPVDLFNAGPGQTDPFLSFFVRQPLPAFIPGHMEALVDVRNLLAQGYVPVVGQDGHTLYLVQSARSVRGGVAFTF